MANEVTGTVNGDVIQAGTVNLNKAVEPEVTAGSMAAARAAYARRVRETYGRLDLEVLTPLSEQGEHPAVELREVFVTPQVRENPPPVELPRELVHRLLTSGEFTAEELPGDLGQSALERLRNEYLNRPTEDVLSVLAGPRGERVVLLGDPGSGKSTLARYLALTLVQDADGPLAPLGGLVPLVVELRQYAEGQWRERTFEDFLDHRHTVAGMSLPGPELRQLLTDGRVVVVLDGLDELFDPGVRAATAERIAAFAARYDRARVVVTSRIIGYQRSALGGAGFTHFMLQDLDPERIACFARRWYAIACPADAELAGRLFDRITSAVEASRPIRELAGNPLLLTILTIIGRRQTLPRDRQGVYEHAVRVLVAHWDRDTKHLSIPLKPGAAEALGLLDDRERLELLRLLARRMQEGTGGIAGNHIHAEELEEVFRDYFTQFGLPPHQCLAAARALRDQLRERNFILARYGGEVYGFVHRAFLEYLAAADIVQRYTVGREWSPEELIEEVFARRVEDSMWHEVLLLVVNRLSEADAGRVVDHLLEQENADSLILAFQSLAEVRKIGLLNAQSSRAIDSLVAALSAPEFAGAIGPITTALTALTATPAWAGRGQFLFWFHLQGLFTEMCRKASMVAAAFDSTIEGSLARITFGHPSVRASAVEALAHRWVGHAGLPATLLELTAENQREDVRSRALAELATRWPEHHAVLPLALRSAARSPDASARRSALRLLERRAQHPAVLPLLLKRATADPDWLTRETALRALRSGWPDHPDVQRVLQEAEEPRGGYRYRRETTLVHVPGPSDSLTDFMETAKDANETVRAFAVPSLARTWPTADEVRRVILDLATEDPAIEVRRIAVRELADHWPGDPEVRALFWQLATADTDGELRCHAVEGIAASDDSAPETLALLTRSAMDPESTRLRALALTLLATLHGAIGGTTQLLLTRAHGGPCLRGPWNSTQLLRASRP
ncbi:NACHT domain-containing protein [Kitasatospora sp. NPDC058048]|uniref:NACHT domain-containing protein n=1 Tax=Kitasatospora sp. NPDC058048 TaxID=3346313 RepID=UPI0036DED406